MQSLWRADHQPGIETRLEVVSKFASDLRELGPANFIYSDGDTLFAHGHKRHQPDGTICAPGLWRLARHCSKGGEFTASGLNVVAQSGGQDVVLVASVPMSGEAWAPLAEGSVLAMRQGLMVSGSVTQ